MGLGWIYCPRQCCPAGHTGWQQYLRQEPCPGWFIQDLSLKSSPRVLWAATCSDQLGETETTQQLEENHHTNNSSPLKTSNFQNDWFCSLTLKVMRERSWRHLKHKPTPQNPNSRCFSHREAPQGCLHEKRGMRKLLLLLVPFHKPQSAELNSITQHFLHKQSLVTAR